jgi:hypothetical protein
MDCEMDYAQVVLFGSIQGGWRESHVIPTLEALGVTYFNPVITDGDWTPAHGDIEAEIMANCETIVMVINCVAPSFSALAETGWAALGALHRGQHFILQVDQGCAFELPEALRAAAGGQNLDKQMQHYIRASRYLVNQHARYFQLDRLHVVDDLEGVVAQLREIYI